MKTIYLKTVSTKLEWVLTPNYYKVTEHNVMQVSEGNIETESIEDFYEEVAFIKGKLIEYTDRVCEEITREEFDKALTAVVNEINHISAA